MQMLSTHPGLSELLEQFRKHPAFQAPTDLSNHVSPAQIRACWPPWAPRTPPSLTPHAKRAATHLGKRPAPTPTPSPHPTGINESTAHPQQPPTQQALKSLTGGGLKAPGRAAEPPSKKQKAVKPAQPKAAAPAAAPEPQSLFLGAPAAAHKVSSSFYCPGAREQYYRSVPIGRKCSHSPDIWHMLVRLSC